MGLLEIDDDAMFLLSAGVVIFHPPPPIPSPGPTDSYPSSISPLDPHWIIAETGAILAYEA